MGKIRKILKKRCPECYGKLELITEISMDEDNISYSEDYEVCLECGYRKLIISKHNRKIARSMPEDLPL